MEDGRAGVQAGKWVWSWTVLTSGGQVSHCSIVMKVQVHPLKRLLNTLFLKRLTFETCVAAAAQLLQRRLSAALLLTMTFLLPLFLTEILKIWSIHQVVLWFGFDSAGILIYRCWVLERQLSFFFIPKWKICAQILQIEFHQHFTDWYFYRHNEIMSDSVAQTKPQTRCKLWILV